MDKDYFIQLTLGLYRVTDLFPENEPLRIKLREKANEVLAHFAAFDFRPQAIDGAALASDLNILTAYLDLAKLQNWADARNFLVLSQGYANIKELLYQKVIEANVPAVTNKDNTRLNNDEVQKSVIKPASIKRDKTSSSAPAAKIMQRGVSLPHAFNGHNQDRQAKIQTILAGQGPMRLIQLLEHFPQINKRTLRRDLTYLVSQKVLDRYDVGKLTFYKVKQA